MVRIVNVGNFNRFKMKQCFVNADCVKISNGLIRNGHQVFDYNDRDMVRALGFEKFKKLGKKRLQKKFIEFVDAVLPDAILLCHADLINVETIKHIKNKYPTIKVLSYNVDPITTETENGVRNIKNINKVLDVLDVLVITCAEESLLSQFKRDNNYVGFFPNSVDESIENHKIFDIEKTEYDLIFAGSASKRKMCGQMVSCQDLYNQVEAAVDGIKVYTYGLNKKGMKFGSIYNNSYKLASMGLNLSRVNDLYLASSNRMAHIMGNGLLCVTERASGFDKFFTDEEICFYSSKEELFEKLKFYKENPKIRMAHAKSGHDKYKKIFNERVVASYFEDLLLGNNIKGKYAWT